MSDAIDHDRHRARLVFWVALALSAAAVGTFVALRASVAERDRVVAFDRRTTEWIVAHRDDVLTVLMRAATGLGYLWVVWPVLVVVCVLLVRRGRRDLALLLVLSSVGTTVLVNGAKVVVQRPRPPVADRLVPAEGWAFPSGHAGQGVALYLALGLVVWCVASRCRVRVLGLVAGVVLAVAVGASRVYLGVHWTSDVLGGWLLALGWLALLVAFAAASRWRALSATAPRRT